jgi:UDP-N-acetylglucosamine 2-epimerase
MQKKTVVTITGIRPDFIRMSYVFKELDLAFNHILIHTGQHFDSKLSGVFFTSLGIRNPDYILSAGKNSSNHYEQLAYLTLEIPKLFKENNINPDLIIFLGDSNSVAVSFPLKKQGYKIAHIEAGMRSYDKRMLEEINRTVCDHCSDILFVYHENYAKQLELENIKNEVHIVGNTIVEPVSLFKSQIMTQPKKLNCILMDIHRPENFLYESRLKGIIEFGNACYVKYKIPVKILYFPRLANSLEKYNLDMGSIELIDLMDFPDYLNMVYNSKFLISDSGTAQEEPALLNTPVVVPRDWTERPESFASNCSVQLFVEGTKTNSLEVFVWLEKMFSGELTMCTQWLGTGSTSKLIVEKITKYLS